MDKQTGNHNKAGHPAKVLFLGKRFYTNRDALEERYGRIYQLPAIWAEAGIQTKLWLIDYHNAEKITQQNNRLSVCSTPVIRSTLNEIFTHLILQQPYTHVIASGDCYLGLLGYLIAKRSSAEFIFDVYDKYDEFGGYRRLPGFDPFSFLLKRADRRLFASQALCDQLGNPNGVDLVVVNGIDKNAFYPRELTACRDELNLPQETQFIGYFGSMEPDRGVQDLISAVRLLRNEGLDIMLIIGGKQYPGMDLSGEGIQYMGNIPFDQMPMVLGACNLLSIPYRRSAFMDAGASNKIAEAIAVNRPIVATRTPNLLANFSDAAESLKDRFAEPGNAREIAQLIRSQLSNPIEIPAPRGWDWSSIAQNTAIELGLITASHRDDNSDH